MIIELTLKDLTADGKISDQDFMDRVDLLSTLGYTVMISNYLKYYKMIDYLSSIAKGKLLGVILGVYNLANVFEENFYSNLPGGILEAFGRGFGHNVKLFVYPAINVEDGELYELSNFQTEPNLKGLFDFMVDNDKLVAFNNYNTKYLYILSDDVLSKIKAGASSWEEDVPTEVVKAIKFYELFGFKEKITS